MGGGRHEGWSSNVLRMDTSLVNRLIERRTEAYLTGFPILTLAHSFPLWVDRVMVYARCRPDLPSGSQDVFTNSSSSINIGGCSSTTSAQADPASTPCLHTPTNAPVSPARNLATPRDHCGRHQAGVAISPLPKDNKVKR